MFLIFAGRYLTIGKPTDFFQEATETLEEAVNKTYEMDFDWIQVLNGETGKLEYWSNKPID